MHGNDKGVTLAGVASKDGGTCTGVADSEGSTPEDLRAARATRNGYEDAKRSGMNDKAGSSSKSGGDPDGT